MLYLPLPDHPLLSPKAQRLAETDLDAFEAQARVACRRLGLTNTAFTGADELSAIDAVAMVISVQLERDPQSYIAKSVTRGSRSITYVDGDPMPTAALEIVAELLGEATTAAAPLPLTSQSTTFIPTW